ncbi:hypothetical protein COD86_11620 [Bacillus cereus]|nr:hypothetical protein COD14_31385 [Bacillus cereus]PGV95788.1 hypothetical protein COD86_11620 [Bacillus cereus]
MRKNDNKQQGLKDDVMIYDEAGEHLREMMRRDSEEGYLFSNLKTNGLGSDVQLVGGIDFGKRGADQTIRVANPRLLAKGKENE